LSASTAAAATASQPSATTRAAPVATTVAVTRPTSGPVGGQPSRRDLQLSTAVYPNGVQTPAGYQQYLDRQAARLGRAIEAAPTPAQTITASLELLRWQLSRQIEPAVSRLLLGIATDQDRQQIARICHHAASHLSRLEALLQELSESSASSQPHARHAWREQFEMLRPLPAAFAAAVGDDPARCLTAADSLEPLTAAHYGPLAHVARFWRALLLARAGRYGQALELLDLALADPQDEPYGIFARLLRCRILAERGYLSVALVLVMQIEKRVERWFDSHQARLAKRAATLLRLELTDRWANHLARAGLTEQAESWLAAARTLRDRTFAPGHTTEMPRLGRVLFGLASTTAPATTTTAPATTRPTTSALPAPPTTKLAE
ncbi:MAG: hypothetical protein ACE5K7_07435, partial [Phycisphaerae bacterium]